MMRGENGERTGYGLAALAFGVLISSAVLLARLFGDFHPDGHLVEGHDFFWGAVFFGGLAIAFPDRTQGYLQAAAGVIRAWRSKVTGQYPVVPK